MASNHGGKDVMDVGSSEGNNSEAMVEIKIKTLDSQTYTLRVDKCVPVPALKKQIASVTGVLSEQQRLICRGKVLKDDQLLSAYRVEDGHTLHMVSRQPMNPSLASFPDHTASDPALGTRQTMGSQHGPSVVVGTFNISEQGDGTLPDFSQVISAVLGSLGIANAGSGGEAIDLQQHIAGRLSQIPGLNEIRNSTGQQPEDASGMSQPNLQDATFTLPTDVSMESLQLPVIPDSLSTLSQYLRCLRQQFNENVRIQGNSSQSLGSGSGAEVLPPHSATAQGGLPTPAALGEVTESTRQLLIEQVGECLMHLTRQLGDQTNETDSVARIRMQSNALRSGALLQNLGAFLLELGRTTMTLRMGQNPTEAVVNAGPAVFISTSGPNPIMVQPLPFQPGTSFGTTPVGSGLLPRNIDIRIRTGSMLLPAVNQRETSGGERSATENPAPSDIRVVPIRVSSLPSGHAPTESSRSSMSVIYPVLAEAQHVDSGSNGSHPNSGENRHPESLGPGCGVLHNGESSGLDQLARNLFPGEPNHGNNNFVFQTTGSETAQTAVSSQEATKVSDQGRFLSNLLHQIMPVVTQHINAGGGPTVQGADEANGAAQPSSSVEENQDGGAKGASSRQSDDPSSLPDSKRQKTE